MPEPITIYRYLDSDAALKTLVGGEFRVGKISKFNDPFEWQFGVGKLTPEDLERVKNFRRNFQQWNDSTIGVLSFSKSIKDPILWSLYAEKHHGIAFEVKHSWSDKEILHITYSNQRPQIDIEKIRQIALSSSSQTEIEEYLKPILAQLIRQKSTSWEFENECRLTVHIKNPDHCQERNGMYYWPILKNLLTRVILGFRCPLEENHVRKLLDMNGFTQTNITRATMCNETYTIRC
jgi:hypothetical protein